MHINTLYRAMFRLGGFRERRQAWFRELFDPTESTTLLDVGGVPEPWMEADPLPDVTVLNIDRYLESRQRHPRTKVLRASALDMPYADGAFDIVHSNSVIEHVGTWENQRLFAAEARRVGRGLWVQTPAREFPVEPHYLTPFIHWLPRSAQRRVVRRGTVLGWVARLTERQAIGLVNEIRLLSHAEMRELFPDCEILVERFLGMPKSYIAFRPATTDETGSGA